MLEEISATTAHGVQSMSILLSRAWQMPPRYHFWLDCFQHYKMPLDYMLIVKWRFTSLITQQGILRSIWYDHFTYNLHKYLRLNTQLWLNTHTTSSILWCVYSFVKKKSQTLVHIIFVADDVWKSSKILKQLIQHEPRIKRCGGPFE